MVFKRFTCLDLISKTFTEGVVSIDITTQKNYKLTRTQTRKMVYDDEIMNYCIRHNLKDVVRREIKNHQQKIKNQYIPNKVEKIYWV